ncbi:hypothetical protein O7599_27805 [Streptomyces sp. WMMC500]|uniref:hypothetical protein n=1 Tax=Streptomyces sp. WMMC500 TaxID=3015154 RepID=UPI00248C1021|nr:hypothetical protein [Streptomyces sp. WMMC500]WBB59351.1 hypothetical protein O7599_27805 [Streptomyces sp. WMMC500]
MAYREGSPQYDVPITEGTVTFDATAEEERRCEFTVPRFDSNGFDWQPGRDRLHPLAPYGQSVYISNGLFNPASPGEFYMCHMGHYLITNVESDSHTVKVTGADLWRKLKEQLIQGSPIDGFGPSNTYQGALGRLTWVGLQNSLTDDVQIITPDFSAMPTNPRLSQFVATPFMSDRTEPIKTLAEAWGARVYVNDVADLAFVPHVREPSGTPVFTFRGGPTGTMLRRVRTQDRDGVYNWIIAQGKNPATGANTYFGRLFTQTGPLDIRGPHGWVSQYYETGQFATVDDAVRTVNDLWAASMLRGFTETVSAVPNAALQLYDTVRVIDDDGSSNVMLILALDVPLTASSLGGEMRVVVGERVDSTSAAATRKAGMSNADAGTNSQR